jgi:chorismate mutase
VSTRHNQTSDASGGDSIDRHRRHIDRIDRTIVALLAERVRLGIALGDIKRAANQPTRSMTREAEVLARVREAAARPLLPSSADRIFRAIIAETAACQERRDG